MSPKLRTRARLDLNHSTKKTSISLVIPGINSVASSSLHSGSTSDIITVDKSPNPRERRDTSSSVSSTVGPAGDGTRLGKIRSGRGITPDIVKMTEHKVQHVLIAGKDLFCVSMF